MDCAMFFYLLLIHVTSLYAEISSLPRYVDPQDPSHLPDSPPTNLRRTDKKLVYGNFNNLGLTYRYDKTNDRVLYTGFRKANDILDLLQALAKRKHKRKPMLVYVNANLLKSNELNSEKNEKVSEVEDNASEILDERYKVKEAIFPCSAELFEEPNKRDFRRRRTHKYSREKIKSDESESRSLGSSSSESSDDEKNPGNPFTIYKNKYRQNWMWNHFMDGDHMNINPYAPQFNSLGPSGASLFFNRKWWYYNQDDYRPFD